MRLLNYIFTLLIVIAFLPGCQKTRVFPEKVEETINTEIQPDQISWNIEVYFVDSSFTKAILKAKRARIYQERAETLLDSGVTCEFLSQRTGKRSSYLTADSARIDDKTKNMLARGHVVVISDSTRTKLETSLLMWDNQAQKLYSTEYVRITSPEERLQGYGFESDLYLNNYKIMKVSGEKK
jgi:LPS export ABC transporter protein LptC